MEDKIDNYRIISPIAEEGMGRVFLARDDRNDRLIAVKVLPEYLLCDRKNLQHLERAFKAVEKIKHPNILEVYGLLIRKGIGYLLMEFMGGGNLRTHIEARNLNIHRIMNIALGMCAGLHHIHHHKLNNGRFHGIVHKNIKPENILFSNNGRIKIADIGLNGGEKTWNSRKLNSGGGTLHYMSPEQIRRKSLDIRTDIYSLGLILYELLTGQLPYKKQPKEFYMKMTISKNVKPDPPSYINRKIPRRADEITLKALEKNPRNRYQAVAEMMLDLQRLAAGTKVVS
jgi:serine/threonine-protein kinase